MTDIAAALKRLEGEPLLWDGLPPEAKTDLLQLLRPVSMRSGQELFREGDPGDALYVLVAGSIGISATDSFGRLNLIARVTPPQTIGEMALLSNGKRSATATVIRDSVLLELDRDAFDDWTERWPRCMSYFSRLLTDRLRDQYHTPAPTRSRTVAIVPATAGVSAIAAANLLGRHLAEIGKTLIVGEPSGDPSDDSLREAELTHAYVVYASESSSSTWGESCLRRADHVFLIAAPGEPLLNASLQASDLPFRWRRRDLVVVQKLSTLEPEPAHASLDSLDVELRLQVRETSPDFARLARNVAGRALGVVFSGGGARGFAHVGVIRALQELGYTIDLVGGTSMGAVIAACVAAEWTPEQILTRIGELVASRPFSDYTIPAVALLRGRRLQAEITRAFRDSRIQELWLPFLCISSNLTTGKIHVHRRGHIADALKASVAIPGLLPPVVDPEGVLVDGAVMNNLPADELAALQRGPVIAVDVSRDLALKPAARASLVRRLFGIDSQSPGIATLLIRAATVASDAQLFHARSQASVVLVPPLSSIGLRSWESFNEAVEIGYAYTRRFFDENPGALKAKDDLGSDLSDNLARTAGP